MTFQAIADALNSEGIPTLRGGTAWRVSSVQAAAGYRRPPPVARRGTSLRSSVGALGLQSVEVEARQTDSELTSSSTGSANDPPSTCFSDACFCAWTAKRLGIVLLL